MLRNKIKRKHSASSLSLCEQCLYKYYLKYIKHYYPIDSTAQMEIGVLAHASMENKINCIINKEEFNPLNEINRFKKVYKEIQEKYLDFDFIPYEEKTELFFKKIKSVEYEGYTPIGTEIRFKIQIHGEDLVGSIDLLLRNNETGRLKVVDFKTSKNKFQKKEADESLQHAIYAYACWVMYGEVPTEYEYDFIFLGQKQQALSKMDEEEVLEFVTNKTKHIFDKMNKAFDEDEWSPNKQILCTWCNYSSQIGADSWYGGICEWEAFWDKEFKKLDTGKMYVPKEYRDEGNYWG